MRQGDGSDLLGPGDPRNSEIGVLYVDSRDSRQEILTAISTQELQGRKQIAIVLPEQGKAFRQPLDFDGLKNMRRQLKAQLIFIAPSGPGPAEFARQRRFAVYSSLDNFKTALLNEGIPAPNPRVKSQPGPTQRSGILGFGRNRASQERTPAAAPVAPPIPPTPRTPTPPTPLVMPPTPRTPAQPGMSAIPSTPRLPNQQLPPAQHIDALDTIELGQLGAQTGATPNGKPGALANGESATGMPAPSGLESDDDALYAPPAQSGPPVPIAQGSATPTGQPRPNSPAQPPQENRAATSIIAFPPVPPSTPNPAPGKAKKGTRASGKMPPAPNGPTNNTGTSPLAGAALIPGSANPPGAASTGANVHDPGQSGTVTPANGKRGGSTGKMATPPANGQPGTTPGAATPNGGKAGGGPGKSAALAAGAALGGAAIGAAAAQGNAGNAGGPGASGVATAGGTRAPGAGAPPIRSGGAGGPGGGQRPTGLTPLPPPYSRRARRRRNRVLALLALLVLLGMALTWGVLANRGILPGVSGIPGLSGNVNATVTITPVSKLESDSYVFAGITSGTPDPTRLQISARLLTQTSGTQTATANATGSIVGKVATGSLVFVNSTGSGITLGTTVLTGKDGVQIRFIGPVFVPSLSSSNSVSAFAVDTGAQGNISALDIATSCCAPGIGVKNPSAFSGGQDAQPNSVIQQSDIDHAAQPLTNTLKQSTQAALAKMVKSNERVADGTLQCTPTVTSSQQPGSVAKTATVQVSQTCTEEVYDFAAAQQLATSRLQTSVQNDPALGSQYALDGQIVTNVNRVTPTNNQLSIQVQAQGLWVYGFSAQLQGNIKQSLVKLSKAAAQSVLLHEMGVANATISISSGTTMPSSANNITLVIQQLPGAQASPGPGTPTVNPTTQPTNAPASSPTAVNGLGGS